MQDYSSLLGNYKLSNFNGVNTEDKDVRLSLKEVEGKLHVEAKVANVIGGELTYEDDKLKGILMSTLMMGSDFEMEVERAIGKGFGEGMTVKREIGAIVFIHDKDKMKFVPRPKMF